VRRGQPRAAFGRPHRGARADGHRRRLRCAQHLQWPIHTPARCWGRDGLTDSLGLSFLDASLRPPATPACVPRCDHRLCSFVSRVRQGRHGKDLEQGASGGSAGRTATQAQHALRAMETHSEARAPRTARQRSPGQSARPARRPPCPRRRRPRRRQAARRPARWARRHAPLAPRPALRLSAAASSAMPGPCAVRAATDAAHTRHESRPRVGPKSGGGSHAARTVSPTRCREQRKHGSCRHVPPPAAADAEAGTARQRERGRSCATGGGGRRWHAAPHGANLGLPFLYHLTKNRQRIHSEASP